MEAAVADLVEEDEQQAIVAPPNFDSAEHVQDILLGSSQKLRELDTLVEK